RAARGRNRRCRWHHRLEYHRRVAQRRSCRRRFGRGVAMRHRVAMRKLSRPTGHRLSLLRNLMTDLIRHERLQTTEPKAAELRREVEKLIGTARANDLHARRMVAAKLYDEAVVRKLFSDIVPRYA